MASVNIKFSQNVIDQQHALEARGTPYDSIGGLVGNFSTGYGIDTDIAYVSRKLDGGTLHIDYTKGVTEDYVGFKPDNATVTNGHATASAYFLHQAGVATVSAVGSLNFDYMLGGNIATLNTSPQGHFLNSLRIATEFASTSPGYDPMFGNVMVALGGRITVGENGEVGGMVNSITLQADKLLDSATIDGTFYLDSSLPNGISGLLRSYNESYADGSALAVNGAFDASANADLGAIYSNAANFGGDDSIVIDLPGRLYAQATVRAGDGNDRISLKGGGGMLGADAGAGNDVITLLGDAHAVDGGAGLDTVQLAGSRAAYGVLKGSSAGSFKVTDQAGAVADLVNVERIAFADKAYALDIDGSAGQIYRLYQVFSRTPDASGLGFWINAIDHGTSLSTIAQGFVESKEFHDIYGAASSNREIVAKFYDTILHRVPDAPGLDFWTNALDQKWASTAQILVNFSDSVESRDGSAILIGNGFEYTPYG